MIDVRFTDQAASGVGDIICNDKVEVMASLSVKDLLMTSSEEEEILTCHWVVECGFSELVVEGDNKITTSSMRSKKCLLSWLWHIFHDVICFLNDLRWSEVHYAKRSANSVTHSLVKYAKYVLSDVIWLEDSPSPAVEALYTNSISIQWILRMVSFSKKKKKSLPFKLLFLTVITYPKRLIVKVKKNKNLSPPKDQTREWSATKNFPLNWQKPNNNNNNNNS